MIIIAIAITTIGVSVAAVGVWTLVQNRNVHGVEIGDEYIALAPPPIPQRFTSTIIACGFVTPYRGRFSSQGYRASTGEGLSRTSYDYFSALRASKELLKEIKHAEKIVERVPNLDDNGKRVGERIVVIFPPNNKGIKRTSIFETNKSSLYEISAPSLELALEVEGKK
jgi:hypothetical protein